MAEEPVQPKLGKWGGLRIKGEQGSGRTLKRGDNRAYILARLRRDRSDLVAKVESGEMSAHAVAVGLGWMGHRRTVVVHGQNRHQARSAVVDIASLIG